MFKDNQFYHSHIRKAIIAFGVLFNGVTIKRIDKNGNIAQAIPVPLSYGPKQKFIARINAAPDLSNGRAPFEVVTPRIGFEITHMAYDPERKLPPTQTVRAINTTNGSSSINSSFVSTPYNMGIKLSVFAKNQDDGLQIMEQILPYFNPDFSITVLELPELGVLRDIMFVLDSVDYSNDYEGDFSKRLTIVWDLNFTLKLNFWGFVDTAKVIRETITNIYTDTTGTPDGVKITVTPDPSDADPTGPFNYVVEFDNILSSQIS